MNIQLLLFDYFKTLKRTQNLIKERKHDNKQIIICGELKGECNHNVHIEFLLESEFFIRVCLLGKVAR